MEDYILSDNERNLLIKALEQLLYVEEDLLYRDPATRVLVFLHQVLTSFFPQKKQVGKENPQVTDLKEKIEDAKVIILADETAVLPHK